MKTIEVTLTTGRKAIIFIDKISYISAFKQSTFIHMNNSNELGVVESIDEVKSLIRNSVSILM